MKIVKSCLLAGLILMSCSLDTPSSFVTPTGWFIAGSDPDSYDMGIDEGKGHDIRINSATIKSIDRKISGFGTLMQQCSPDNFLGQRVRMTGYIKSENIKGSSGLWLRIDRGSKPVSFDNMDNRHIKGTTEWKKYEIVLDIPNDATRISYGALVSGTGQIWFDNLMFEIVDDTVKPTSSINSKESSIATLDRPSNLDFEN